MKNLDYGRVYTTRIQKPHFSGLGVFDPKKVFFKEDPNGKVYVDDKLVKIVDKDEANLVFIGNRLYKTVTIGEQTWLAENLELPFTDGTYYNDDPTQSYGLLYKGTCIAELIEYLRDNNVGWHIPSETEMQKLITAVGGSTAASHLKSTTSWNSGTSDNASGFDLKAAGLRVGTTYDYKGSNGSLWTSNADTTQTYPSYRRLSVSAGNNVLAINSLVQSYSCSIRLVKD